MKIRNTARLILLDPSDRVLLMNIKSIDVSDPNAPLQRPFWVTIGGKIEDGETLQEAAQREAFEETGHKDINVGSPVWKGKVILNWKGEPTELNETFLIARASHTKIIRDNLTDEEKIVVQKYKWWSVEDLKQTTDIIIPKDMAIILPALLGGAYPDAPIDIDLSTPEGPVKKKPAVPLSKNSGPS